MYRLVGYSNLDSHEKFSQDKQLTEHIFNPDDIVAVTDEQFVVPKLRYPDIETLGFIQALDYFD